MTDQSPLRLSDLTALIREHLQDRFAKESFWVVADVSDHKYYPQKKYHYFDLVEKDDTSGNLVSRVSAVAWQDGAMRIAQLEKDTGQRFAAGIRVLVRVRVEFNPLYGLKLIVMDVDSRFTLGELERKKQETIRRLLAECPEFIRMVDNRIITRNHGHPLHMVLQRIAVLGSRQSAGYEDFIHTLEENPYGYRFHVDSYHVSVQGEDKARELFEQLINIFKTGKRYDVVVIIRGGGSESDFLIFNDYNLNRAIAKFPIPVITGIGHLKDQSIADLMAHTETKTPTKAAEFIVAHNKMFEDRILLMQKQVMLKAQQICNNRQRQLTLVNNIVVNKSRDSLQVSGNALLRLNQLVSTRSAELVFKQKNALQMLAGNITLHPRLQVSKHAQVLETVVNNLHTFQQQYFKNKNIAIQHLEKMVMLASPEQTLKRGFAMVMHKGKVISSATQVEKDDDLELLMHDATLRTIVKEIKKKS